MLYDVVICHLVQECIETKHIGWHVLKLNADCNQLTAMKLCDKKTQIEENMKLCEMKTQTEENMKLCDKKTQIEENMKLCDMTQIEENMKLCDKKTQIEENMKLCDMNTQIEENFKSDFSAICYLEGCDHNTVTNESKLLDSITVYNTTKRKTNNDLVKHISP